MQSTSSFQIYNASAGSGKTFTLVKEYLKVLLTSENQYKFQNILAVTFTNKAAGEMKERVIENLREFSNQKESEMLSSICFETNLNEKIIFERAQKILNSILQNYSAFNITTIDSFTYKLVRTFAQDLELSQNADVEMDTDNLLDEAVDLVISKIGSDKKLTRTLIKFAIDKLNDNKSWDISFDLKKFAKIILNESDSNYIEKLNEISISEFESLKTELQKKTAIFDEKLIEIGENALKIIDETGLDYKDFYRSMIPNHFIKQSKNLEKATFFDESKLKERLEGQTFYSKSKPDSVKEKIDSILPNLLEKYYQSENLYEKRTLNKLILNSLIPLATLKYINDSLTDLKNDNNILLNAEFNKIISNTIKDEPAPFIYERIGEKFRYYFVDEMQDTSVLQWENLIPLFHNAISSEDENGETGKLLLVGDAKQSIYRWRGGKPEQFIELTSKEQNINPFFVEEKIINLPRNYRSYSEIIKFNNHFFTHISQHLTNTNFENLYSQGNNQELNKNEGGYIQVSFVEKQNDDEEKDLVFAKKVLKIIENLDSSFQKNEICVLVRKKKDGVEVAKYLSKNGIKIISSETLLLDSNEKVKFIINLLKTIQNPSHKSLKVTLLYFLFEHLNLKGKRHVFISEFVDLPSFEFFKKLKEYDINFDDNKFIQLPFYESIEYILQKFKLTETSDSYIQFFLDVVFEFQQKKHVSINKFLDYWELRKQKFSIVAPESKNSIRIMTIHKAKGLEFPVVIYPYSIDIYRETDGKIWYPYKKESPFEHILINSGKKLKSSGEIGQKLFQKKKEELELDNFNLIYVAMTRAVEQLYIVLPKLEIKKPLEIKNTSHLFIDYLEQNEYWDEDKNDYGFGNSVRTNKKIKEENNAIIQGNFISNSWKNHNISIVANSNLLWDNDRGKSINYGNLIHEILSKIKTEIDVSEAINQYIYKGIITSEESKEINSAITKIINHSQLKEYFNQNHKILNEQEILTSNSNILIPDRLVIKDNKVTIIDYKTGKPNKKYIKQINVYASILIELGYEINKKLLVYISDKIIVEEIKN